MLVGLPYIRPFPLRSGYHKTKKSVHTSVPISIQNKKCQFGWSDQENISGYELCSPFMTSTPSFIQIGSKLAKLVFWGEPGGYGVGWWGG